MEIKTKKKGGKRGREGKKVKKGGGEAPVSSVSLLSSPYTHFLSENMGHKNTFLPPNIHTIPERETEREGEREERNGAPEVKDRGGTVIL